MSNFFNWCVRNQDAITWFLIGWLSFSAVDHFIKGQYGWALFNVVLVYVNYKFSSVRIG